MSSCLSILLEELKWLIAVCIYKEKIILQGWCVKYTKAVTEKSINSDYCHSAFIKYFYLHRVHFLVIEKLILFRAQKACTKYVRE